MLYLVVLILILYTVCKFDVCKQKRYRNSWFYFLLIIFIIIAGFSYRLGYDNANYMREFSGYQLERGYGWQELTNHNGRQPFWVLMNLMCKSIIDSYSFFRFAHALLINTLFFLAFRRLTKHLFSAILFYFVLAYFEFNFQVMRQSVAVALFLISISKYDQNKWLSYYVINSIGFLFHEAALITFLVPVVKYIGISIFSILIFFTVSILGAVIGPLIVEIILPNIVDSFIADKAFFYMSGIDDKDAIIGLNIVLNVLIPFVFILWKTRNNKNNVVDYFVILYGVLYGLGLSVPLIYRFNQFFQLCFLISYIEIFNQLAIWAKTKFGLNANIVFMCVSFLFLGYRSRMYFLPFGDTNVPSYVQYYPYHSILFEKKNPTREALLAM